MKKYLLGIDNGGSDIKCAVFDFHGNEISAAGFQVPLSTPAPGFTERDAEDVWKANVQAIKEAIRLAGISSDEIAGIGVTAYGNGLVFTDENIQAVYPAIVSTDSRAAEYCKRFEKDGTERAIFPFTRQTTWPAQPAVLIPWFRDNRPDVLEKTRWILSMKDFIRYRLTGCLNGELTEASSTCLMNLDTGKYDPYIFECLGITDCLEKMPSVLESTAVAGVVSKEAALLTGLGEGTPVAAGYFDIDANALASGILSDEYLCLIAGTWSINEFLTKTAAADIDKKTNIATLSYLSGHYIMEDSTPTSAGNFNWYIRNVILKYCPEMPVEDIYKRTNSMVGQTTPFDSSVIFVPYLYGSATHPDAHGAILNITGADSQEAVLRAIYEGVVFSTVHHVHALKRPVSSYREARLSGGVANSEVWSQMMADALQIPIRTLEGTQLGAKGAVMGAGVACGVFKDLEEAVKCMVRPGRIYEPNKDYAAIYSEKYERYEKALKAVDMLAAGL